MAAVSGLMGRTADHDRCQNLGCQNLDRARGTVRPAAVIGITAAG